MRRWTKIRSERGSAAVETALSSLIFLSLLFGMFEGFVALYSYHYVSYAAREATRYAMVRGANCSSTSSMPNCGATSTEIQQFVYDLNFPGINVDNLTVTATWLSAATTTNANGYTTTTWTACATQCNAIGNQVQVVVTDNNPLDIPFYAEIPLSISATSTMVISQ
jgi:Flp pilus assembly protein TadG